MKIDMKKVHERLHKRWVTFVGLVTALAPLAKDVWLPAATAAGIVVPPWLVVAVTVVGTALTAMGASPLEKREVTP